MKDHHEKIRVISGVSSLLRFGSGERTFRLRFDFLRGGMVLRVWPIGLIHMVCTRDFTDWKEDDFAEIVDVQVRYGTPTKGELGAFEYQLPPPDVWVLHFEGHMLLTIVCIDITMEELELKDLYPSIWEQWQKT